MFSPDEFLTLEHTAHSKLFENQKYVWDALKQIASYLQFRLKPAVLGELVGKPFISDAVFIGEGTIIEQGRVLERSGLDRGELSYPQWLLRARKRDRRRRRGAWVTRASSRTASSSTKRRCRISIMSAIQFSVTARTLARA